MAYLSATDLNDIQEIGGIDEKRYSQLGLVEAAADSTQFIDFISPSKVAEMNKISSQRNVQIPVIKDQTVSVVTTPGFNFIPSNLPESAQYTFAAVDLFSGFRFYPASYEDNAIDMEWEKMRRMKAVTYAMGLQKEALIQSTLETRKTQVWAGENQVSIGATADFAFNSGTDTLEITMSDNTDTIFSSIQAMFSINELEGSLRYVANRGAFHNDMMKALKYGADNEKNLAALGLPEVNRYYQTGTISTTDIFDGYVFRDGAIGLVENYPYDFRNGTSFAGKEWSVSDMENPYTRSRLNVYVDTQATEATSLINNSNMKMTHFQEMALWDRFFIVYPYNSDLTTRANDIVKINGSEAA